jgi:hypothetical protein
MMSRISTPSAREAVLLKSAAIAASNANVRDIFSLTKILPAFKQAISTNQAQAKHA